MARVWGSACPRSRRRVGREHADLVQREVEDRGDGALQQVGVLHGGVDVQAAGLGRDGDRAAGLDREVGDHRERVGVLHDDRRPRLLGGYVAPGVVRVLEDVRLRECVARPDRGVLDEVGAGGEGGVEGVDAGQLRGSRRRRHARPPGRRRRSRRAPPRPARRGSSTRPSASTGRSVCETPNRGIGEGRSAGVTTSTTPGIARAAAASMPSTSAQPTGTVTSATCRAPGNRRSATKRCAPDARSPPPYRSTGRPT